MADGATIVRRNRPGTKAKVREKRHGPTDKTMTDKQEENRNVWEEDKKKTTQLSLQCLGFLSVAR